MRRLLVLVSLLVVSASTPSFADTITQFGASGLNSANINADLTGLGIPANAGSETSATSFLVPGSSGTVTLTFSFLQDLGGFLFSFGYFDLSTVSADPVTQQQLYATQALAGATLVFDDITQDPGATSSKIVNAGQNLGFFLIPNNTLAAFNSNPAIFFPSQKILNPTRSPLFSVTPANPGGFDQMLSFVGNGKTMFAFEDLTRSSGDGFSSDNSFTDLVFSVDSALQPVNAVPEPASLLLVGSGLAACVRSARRRRQSVAQSERRIA